MNWSWNGGDPSMRGWGLVIVLGIAALAVIGGCVVIIRRVTRNDSGRR